MRLCSLFLLLALAVPASADSLTLEAVLPQTSSDVPVVAFSPDGKTLFAASYRTTQLWETATWQLRESLPYCAKSFALAREGHVLAATSPWYDPLICVFDASTGQVRAGFKSDMKLDINAQALAPDGKLLALGGYPGLWLFDVRSGRETSASGEFRHPIDSLAFCSDGKLLAVGCQNGEIVLWDVPRAKEVGILEAHQKRVYSLAYSADGGLLASVGRDNAIRLWDVKAKQQRVQIAVHVPFEAYFVAITRDGKRVASVSTGEVGVVKVWDARDGGELATLRQRERAFSIAFSPDGKRLAVRFKTRVKVWKLVDGRR